MVLESGNDFKEFCELIKNFNAICFYLSKNDCNVCKSLKPKIIEMIESDFPMINFCYINIEEAKEISGQFSVFSVPTIIFYFDGKETIRISRNVNLLELKSRIERFYNLFFN